jgi:REP element-mobilizing transposase RayT
MDRARTAKELANRLWPDLNPHYAGAFYDRDRARSWTARIVREEFPSIEKAELWNHDGDDPTWLVRVSGRWRVATLREHNALSGAL